MSSILRALIFFLISVCMIRDASCMPTRRALAIGNDTYVGNWLQNARNDARGMASALTELGYKSTLVLDADREDMRNAVEVFASTIQPGDIILIYYSGHGLQVAGENYLVPTNFRVMSSQDVPNSGVALSYVLAKVIEKKASTQIIILDACRDNPFIHSRAVGSGWAPLSTSAGTYLAFGTAPGSTASDNPGQGHGLFTQALLRHISAQQDIDQLFQSVREEVIRASNGEQIPWTASSLIGTLRLNPAADSYLAQLSPMQQTQSVPSETLSRTASTTVPAIIHKTDDSGGSAGPMIQTALDEVKGFHFDAALRILDDVLSLYPSTAATFRLTGIVLHLLGRNREAIQSFDRALELSNSDPLTLSYRCLVTIGSDPKAAAIDCGRAVRIQDNNAQAHLGLALIFKSRGEFAQGLVEINKAIMLSPGSPENYSMRGELQEISGRHALAIADYTLASRLALLEKR